MPPGFYVWLGFVIGSVLLWLFLVFTNPIRRKSGMPPILFLSMLALFFINVIVYLLMFGACFLLFDPDRDGSYGWPLGALWIWIILYFLAELVSFIYFFAPGPNWFTDCMACFHNKVGLNPFKGWGGQTFADLTNGVGVLVVVGINLVFQAHEGKYWWAGQIAAIMSVISAVAWVQRYSFENPEFEKPEEKRSLPSDIIPTCLSAAASMLTAFAVFIPTTGNIEGRTAAGITNLKDIYLPWLIVFVIWFLITLAPWLFHIFHGWGVEKFPRWPPKANDTDPNRRGNLYVFNTWMSILGVAGIVFTGIAWANSPLESASPEAWPDTVGAVFGYFTALVFIGSQSLKVGQALKKYYASPNNPALLNSAQGVLTFMKDFVFLVAGGVFFLVQWAMSSPETQTWITAEGALKYLYLILLGFFGLFCFIGVIADSYRMIEKWGRPQERPACPWDPVPAQAAAAVQMAPVVQNQGTQVSQAVPDSRQLHITGKHGVRLDRK